ncbi:MAG TPA: fumarylacetoacetate hydrolase family protein [Phycisphaerae bacterium]|nr:fumarylacetoacetate hydrolase family protein [Phycisphaerae bacterium]
MRLCQFYHSADERLSDLARRVPVHARLGVVIGGKIVDVTDKARKFHDIHDPQYAGVLTAAVAGLPQWGEFRAEIATLDREGGVEPADVFFGPCVLRPSQYLDFYAFEQHVMTMRKQRGFDTIVPEWYEIPAYYNSNATSFLGHGMTAYYPPGEEKMDYECELACVIGRPVRNATPQSAAEAIVGYTILNDLSARARQTKAMPINMGPAPGKDFASALGPYLVTKDEIADVGAIGMRAYVNGEKWTDGKYGTVTHRFEEMIAYASTARTFFPGDVLGSGTVGGGCGAELKKFLKPGDKVRMEFDGLGELENSVEHEASRQA